MSELAIRVENVGKRYTIGDLHRTVGQGWWSWVCRRNGEGTSTNCDRDQQEFWALRDVNFELPFGEVLGIVGRNGAGKSTLLKILSRVTAPTTGWVELTGRVGSLLEVGVGFHPDLSGRENVYLNGAVLGLTRGEVRKRFDEIVHFAEIETFIDTPVKRYSTGMYMRLAFAVAAHLDTEILIVDEVLAVGDVAFQRKCTKLMRDVRRDGRTVLFVSHSMSAIAGLCTQAMLIEEGLVTYHGTMEEAVRRYLCLGVEPEERELPFDQRRDRIGEGPIRLAAIELHGDSEGPTRRLRVGKPAEFHFLYEIQDGAAIEDLLVGFNIRTTLDAPVLHHNNRLTRTDLGRLPRRGRIVFRMESLPLVPDEYVLSYALMPDWGRGGRYYDCINHALQFAVTGGDYYGTGELPMTAHATTVCDGQWELVKE